MKRVAGLLVLVLVVVGMVVLHLVRVREKTAAPLLEKIPAAVRVVPVTEGRVAETRHFLGDVIGADEAEVAPRIMAAVVEVRVREQDRVRKGQLLARLDPRELEDAVAAAEAALAAAREGEAAAETAWAAQRDATARDRVLYENDAISREQWDRSRAREDAARAALEAARARRVAAERELDRARTRLSYAEIRAPFDGVVAARLADPGDLAVPGRPLLRLVRDGGVRVRVAVPEELLTRISKGSPAVLTPAAPGAEPFTAAVSRVFPAVAPDRLGRVEIDVPAAHPGLVSGGSCGVDLAVAEGDGPVVPVDALLEQPRGAFVVTVRDGKAHVVPVRVLARDGSRAVVEPKGETLAAGEKVVTARPSRLALLVEGAPVQEIER